MAVINIQKVQWATPDQTYVFFDYLDENGVLVKMITPYDNTSSVWNSLSNYDVNLIQPYQE